jgi:hypothetical protein
MSANRIHASLQAALLPPQLIPKPKPVSPPRARRGKREGFFVSLPASIVRRLVPLGLEAARVYMAIKCVADMTSGRKVRVYSQVWHAFGCHRNHRHRGLRRLVEAGMVRVTAVSNGESCVFHLLQK